MKIQSTLRIAPLSAEPAAALAGFVEDSSHYLAVTADTPAPTKAASFAQVAVDQNLTLKALPSDHKQWSQAQKLAFAKAAASAGSAALPLVRKYLPGISGSAIDGFEFVFSTTQAIHSWSDPKRTSAVKPVLKSARAAFELFDLLKIAMPTLEKAGSYVEAVSVLVKIGDTVYQLYSDVKDIENSVAR